MYEDGWIAQYRSHEKEWIIGKFFEKWLPQKRDSPKLYRAAQSVHELKGYFRSLIFHQIQ